MIRIAVGTTLWSLPLVRTPRLDSAEYFSWAQRLAAGESAWPVVSQHGPGYPVFLAALLAIGGSLSAALILQALICASTAVFVGGIASRTFGERAGFFAGVAYALYGPAVYVETVVLSEGLLLLLLSLAIWALARDRMTWPMAALAGAAIGAATVVRPTAIVIGAACLSWLLIRSRSPRAAPTPGQHKGLQAHTGHKRATLVSIVSFVVAQGIVVVPVVAKNYALSHSLSIQGYGGLNVYIGNSPLHDGRATFRLGKGWDALNSEALRAGIIDPAAQDRYYLRKTVAEIAAHPGGYLALVARKALWMFQAEELRDSHSYYFFTARSPLLRVLPRFGVLFPLACIGVVVLAWPIRAAELQPWWTTSHFWRGPVGLLAFYTLAAASTLVFLVVGLRYRIPLAPVLAILAGVGTDGTLRAVHARRTLALAVDAAVVAGAVAVSHLLNDPASRNPAEEWAFTGSSLITEHNLNDAEAAYRRAIALDSQSGLAWDGLGLALYDAGRLGDARAAFERALALDGDNSRALFHLALLDEREGKLAAAAAGYERALALSPYDAEVKGHFAAALRTHAIDLGMTGRTREARDELRRALSVAADDGEAWLDLCLLSLDLGQRDEAAAALQRAKNLGADPARVAFAEQALGRQ